MIVGACCVELLCHFLRNSLNVWLMLGILCISERRAA